MHLRQMRRGPPAHLVLHLELPDPLHCRSHLPLLVRISRRGHPLGLKLRIPHPRLQRGLRDPEVVAHRLLRDARLDKRDTRGAIETETGGERLSVSGVGGLVREETSGLRSVWCFHLDLVVGRLEGLL